MRVRRIKDARGGDPRWMATRQNGGAEHEVRLPLWMRQGGAGIVFAGFGAIRNAEVVSSGNISAEVVFNDQAHRFEFTPDQAWAMNILDASDSPIGVRS